MRWRQLATLAVVLAIIVFAGSRFLGSSPVETDLLALLPATERNPVAEQAAGRMGRAAGERVVFLVGAPGTTQARQAATLFAEALAGPATGQIVTRVPAPDYGAVVSFYRPYQEALLTAADETRLAEAAGYRQLLDQRLHQPFGTFGVVPLESDPFGLFDAWLRDLPFQQFRLREDAGWLQLTADGRTWVLVTTALQGSAFDPEVQRRFQAQLERAEQALRQSRDGATLLRVGAVFHAAAARRDAERDIRLIGLGSLAGVSLLLLLAYRSLAPLLLGLLSAVAGVSAGVLATEAVFGKLHLMTLVFGSSLMGEAVDYGIQFFAARMQAGRHWQPLRGLAAIRPALRVALLTSLVGYAALAVAPFPALRQIAVFAIAGLLVAWLTTGLLMPLWLVSPQKKRFEVLLRLPESWLMQWRTRLTPARLWGMFLLMVLVAAPGWLQLRAEDDVRLLINTAPSLAAEEAKFRDLTGMAAGSQFFLVEGAGEEELLQREEALRGLLMARGGDLIGVSRFVPSCQRQQSRQRSLQDGRETQQALLREYGFQESVVADWLARQSGQPSCLLPSQWLATETSQPFRRYWLGATAHGLASIAMPQGLSGDDVRALSLERLEGVLLVDKAQSVSQLFADYRALTAGVLVGVAILMLGVLAWRYGTADAVRVLTPVVIGQGVALAVPGYGGVPINLFHLLALLLVIGVGINYTVFLREADGERTVARQPAVWLGVVVSAVTTLLSFGLLSFSSMPALASFGSTLGVGVLVAVLLAPSVLVGRIREGEA